jgi:transcription-repair coupling factor (superfamily II helicase)
LRATDLSGRATAKPTDPSEKIERQPATFIATRLVAAADNGQRIAYVALSEGTASAVVDAVRCLEPKFEPVFLPPWDCLPYDRVPPSRLCMGRRMEALWAWSHRAEQSPLLVTSLDALLQRVPPKAVVSTHRFKLAVGETFDQAAFERFAQCTGYVEGAVVDDHGEYSIRADVIDIFPASSETPIRVLLSDQGQIVELRTFDALSQRTRESKDEICFGPASEVISAHRCSGEDDLAQSQSPLDMERHLLSTYGTLETVFDALGNVPVLYAAGSEKRTASYHAILDDARQADCDLRGRSQATGHSLYLDRAEWLEATRRQPSIVLDMGGAEDAPRFYDSPNPRRAFTDFVTNALQSNWRVVIAGRGNLFENLSRRAERASKVRVETVGSLSAVEQAKPGSLLKFSCDLERGFIRSSEDLLVIALGDVVGPRSPTGAPQALAEPDLQIGDAVVHEDHGIGILRDLETIEVDGQNQDAARLVYRDDASILVPMEDFGKIWRYGGVPEAVPLDRLHTEAWAKRRAAIAQDIRLAARHLCRLTRQRQETTAPSFVPPRRDFEQFVARFPYMVTVDQGGAIDSVVADLRSSRQMNRLVCGDVGFGKTEVALRAAATVALCGGQVAIVSPTTVLTRQHFSTFERRFAGTGIRVAMLSRAVPAKEASKVKEELADGKIGIIVATEAILAKDVAFAHLALMVIDEEHRFGTRAKQRMKTLSPGLHRLTMSATPIPRTLQAAMAGLQDVSLLTTPPAGRRPLRTSLIPFDPAAMRIALIREHRRGGQSFVVAPRIEDLDHLAKLLKEIVPELSVRVAHGKMPAAALDVVVVDFADGEGDILLSTNIIESGLDLPRANTIFIWRADRFGLAQLHQLRGRVGRGKAQGIAYLVTGSPDDVSEETRRRLSALVGNDRPGAGLAISLQDLDIRGGGDIAGEDQAGHLKVIGAGLYHKLLGEAVAATSKTTPHGSSAVSVAIGTSGSIPADYVPDATLRLNLYTRLAKASSTSEVDGFAEEFEDRFGELPEDVLTLLRLTRLKIEAKNRTIVRLEAGPNALAITFGAKPKASFVKSLLRRGGAALHGDRLVYRRATASAGERITMLENLLG